MTSAAHSHFNPLNPTENRSRLRPQPNLKLVVFDFDGTLSWLRHGWPGMMCDVVREHVPRREGESAEALEQLLLDEILALNGQPSIRQCERVAVMARERGGAILDPEALRAEFQHRLDAAIERRSERIRSGAAAPEDYLIPGAREFLACVHAANLTPVILSSTIQERVIAEAGLLDVAGLFRGRIFGGTGDPQKFSKRAVFERLLCEEGLSGEQLLAFGDGPTEIRDATELGGVAIAVCSDEEEHDSGRLDERKRCQLSAAGAQAAIANFHAAAGLLNELLGR